MATAFFLEAKCSCHPSANRAEHSDGEKPSQFNAYCSLAPFYAIIHFIDGSTVPAGQWASHRGGLVARMYTSHLPMNRENDDEVNIPLGLSTLSCFGRKACRQTSLDLV